MHRDFYCFGTYLAARCAGFEHNWVLNLGEYIELVDETWNSRKSSKMGSHKNYVAGHDKSLYWNPEDFLEVKHKRGSIKSFLPKVQRTVTAVMSAKIMQKVETDSHGLLSPGVPFIFCQIPILGKWFREVYAKSHKMRIQGINPIAQKIFYNFDFHKLPQQDQICLMAVIKR